MKQDEKLSGRNSANDPYCAFRDDRERRIALISRDIRIALVRLATVAVLVVLSLNGWRGP